MGILNDLVKMDFMKQGSGAINDLMAYNNYQNDMERMAQINELITKEKNKNFQNFIQGGQKNPAIYGSQAGQMQPQNTPQVGGSTTQPQNLGTGQQPQSGSTLNPAMLNQMLQSIYLPQTINAIANNPTQQPTPQGGNAPVSTNTGTTTPQTIQQGGGTPPQQAGVYPQNRVLSEDLLRVVLPGGVDKTDYYKLLAGQDYSNNKMMSQLLTGGNPWVHLQGGYDHLYDNMTKQDEGMRKVIEPKQFSVGDKVYERDQHGVITQVAGVPPKLDPEIEKLKQDKLPKKTKFAAFTTTPKVGDTEFIVTHWQEVDEKGNPVFIKDPVTGKDIPKIIEQTDINGNPYHPSDDGSGRRLDFQEKERRLYPNLSKVEDNFKQIQKIKPTQVIDKDGKPTGEWEYRVETKDGSGKYRAFKTQEELLRYAFENTEKEFFEANEVLEKHYGRDGTVKVNGKPLLTEMVNSLERLLRQNKGRLDELNPGTGNKKRYDLVNDIIDKVYADKIPTKDIENLRLWLKAKMLNGDLGL